MKKKINYEKAIALLVGIDEDDPEKWDKKANQIVKALTIVDEEGNEMDAALVVSAARPDEEKQQEDEDEDVEQEQEGDDEEGEMRRLALNVEQIAKAMRAQTRLNDKRFSAVQESLRVEGGDTRNDDKGKAGFKTLGELAMCVKRHALNQTSDEDAEHLKLLGDPRQKASNAPSSFASTAVGADGGFLIPDDFRAELLRHTFDEEAGALMPLCTQFTTRNNSLEIPKDETTPWGSSGVTAEWMGEASSITPSKPVIGSIDVKLHKMGVLVPVTNEMLDDGALPIDQYLNQVAPPKIRYKVDDAILNGDGAAKPLGIRNSGALKTVTRTTATGIALDEIANLLSALPASSLRNARYITNTTVLKDIVKAKVGDTPVLLGQGALPTTGIPGALFQRPLIVHEAAQARDTAGDLGLHDFTQYVCVSKGDGIRADMSVHLYFDRDITAFRFVFRVGGLPWLSAPITQANGGGTVSPFAEIGTS